MKKLSDAIIARNERNEVLVRMCDEGGKTYVDIGRPFGIGGGAVKRIYLVACWKRDQAKIESARWQTWTPQMQAEEFDREYLS